MTLAVVREGEDFTAWTPCPACAYVAVHFLDQPRYEPTDDSPLSKMQRLIARALDSLNAIDCCAARAFDPAGTTVARICVSCSHRWGQR